MSNSINIQPTEFVNRRTGGSTWGVRVYDDNFNFYSNLWEKHEIPDGDIDLIEKVKEEFGDEIKTMFEFVEEFEGSITVGNNEYGWNEIKHLS